MYFSLLLDSNMHECSLCVETYHPSRRVVRILPCGHDYCGPCLQTLHVEGRITCPDCRTQHLIKSVESCPIAYLAYKAQSALSASAAVGGGPQHDRQGRRRRKVDAMKEEQSASLLSVMTDVKEKIQILVKYRSTVEDMGVHLDELVDVFHVIGKLTQQARGGLTLETEQVTKASTTGEEISKGIDEILLKLSEATTPEQILEAVDQGDSLVEAAEDWIKSCGVAHPDVSTIHLAAKVRHHVWLCSSMEAVCWCCVQGGRTALT